jgi:hypothetical protein
LPQNAPIVVVLVYFLDRLVDVRDHVVDLYFQVLLPFLFPLLLHILGTQVTFQSDVFLALLAAHFGTKLTRVDFELGVQV